MKRLKWRNQMFNYRFLNFRTIVFYDMSENKNQLNWQADEHKYNKFQASIAPIYPCSISFIKKAHNQPTRSTHTCLINVIIYFALCSENCDDIFFICPSASDSIYFECNNSVYTISILFRSMIIRYLRFWRTDRQALNHMLHQLKQVIHCNRLYNWPHLTNHSSLTFSHQT